MQSDSACVRFRGLGLGGVFLISRSYIRSVALCDWYSDREWAIYFFCRILHS